MPRNKTAPSAISWYARAVLGQVLSPNSRQPFTENDLNREELDAIRAAIDNARKDGRDYIRYGDYPTKEDWAKDGKSIIGEIDMVFADPARSAMYTLGMAKFDEDGTVYDTYDFAGRPGQKIPASEWPNAIMSSNPRSVFNLIGNAVGLRSGTGRPVQIRTK